MSPEWTKRREASYTNLYTMKNLKKIQCLKEQVRALRAVLNTAEKEHCNAIEDMIIEKEYELHIELRELTINI